MIIKRLVLRAGIALVLAATLALLGGNLRSMDTVVIDWPHIEAPTLTARRQPALDGHGGHRLAPHRDPDADPRREFDGPDFPDNARRAAEILPNGEVFLIPKPSGTTLTRRSRTSSTPS